MVGDHAGVGIDRSRRPVADDDADDAGLGESRNARQERNEDRGERDEPGELTTMHWKPSVRRGEPSGARPRCQAVCRPSRRPPFEIGGLHSPGPLQQFLAGAAQRDSAVDDHIATMGELQGMKGVLLDQEDGRSPVALVSIRGSRGKSAAPAIGASPMRRLVEQQKARTRHQRARDSFSICCSPPDSVAAALVDAFLQQRE